MIKRKIIDIPCILCGSIEYITKLAKNNFQVVTCAKCKLVKTILPPNFDLSSIYGQSYFQGGQKDGYADYVASEKVIKQEFKRILTKLLSFKNNNADNKLLEIGCAYGFFLDLAKEHFNCSGIEISTEAAENAKRKCENIICGPANKENLSAIGEINYVVMLDVIEHLENPAETIENIAGQLSKGGILLLTTGNINSFYAKVSGKYWRLMTPPQHITFFSDITIKNLFAMYGFKILELSIPVKMVPVGLILFQLTRRFRIRLPKFILKGFSQICIPVNLFDTIRIVAVKE
jgi:2-polyprenyl-3-methyl-5-hydroxy-6-metoxy-1,4-benzoquinol methylase